MEDGDEYIFIGDPSEVEIKVFKLKEVIEDNHVLYCDSKSTLDGLKIKYCGQVETDKDMVLAVYIYSYDCELK